MMGKMDETCRHQYTKGDEGLFYELKKKKISLFFCPFNTRDTSSLQCGSPTRLRGVLE